ncbi:MAG TPA: nucleotide exchange factor GrpE [Pseudonocardia sp.]
MSERNDEQEPVVVRDRRRIDPLTGEVRGPGGAQASPGAGSADPAPAAGGTAPDGEPDPADAKLADLTAQLDERTADLQRVSAEYANYRRRTDRDREANLVAARAKLVGDLLPVLDDLDRAATHGDLTGAFKAVGDKLVSVLASSGLASFGAEGDPFDPAVHEAVQHTTSPDVGGPTVSIVMRQGYKMGDRVLRPAMVAVTDRDPSAGPPAGEAPPGPPGSGAEGHGPGPGDGAADERGE